MLNELQKRIDAYIKKPESAEKARNAQILAVAMYNMNGEIPLDLSDTILPMSEGSDSPNNLLNSPEDPKLV